MTGQITPPVDRLDDPRADGRVRIGTWNLAGRWSPAHRGLLEQQNCDTWLLTEVNDRVAVPGYAAFCSAAQMAARRHFAAVLTRQDATRLPDPHPASAAITVGGTTYCSSILPWRSCGSRPPWVGERHGDKTAAVVLDLDASLSEGPLVWGGDWNHALVGGEFSGSMGGRSSITRMLQARQLQVPTADLPHRIDGLLSIDHIAVDQSASVLGATRFRANGLSDHDGYVVEARFDTREAALHPLRSAVTRDGMQRGAAEIGHGRGVVAHP